MSYNCKTLNENCTFEDETETNIFHPNKIACKMDFNLRNLSINDAKSIAKYANNYNVAKNLMNRFPHPYTELDAQQFVEFANMNSHLIQGIEVQGEIVGAIGIHPQSDIFAKNAELGYWLAEPFWGNGIISKAIPQMLRLGFETFDIERIFARPFGSNTASQKVLEKNGFTFEARLFKTIFKNGQFEDELIYAIRKNEYNHRN